MISNDFDSIELSIGNSFPPNFLIEKLKSIGYIEQDYVSQPGDYSVRGYLFDVFPITYRNPVRITFNIDTIEEIKDFSANEQKTFSTYKSVRIIPFSQLFQKKFSRKNITEEYWPVTEIKDLQPGDSIVHLNYGIGQFVGVKILKVEKGNKKFLAIEYDKKEILYLELDEMKYIERYMGIKGKSAKLSKLHSKEWVRIREKTKRAIKGYANDLLEMQAKRQLLKGIKFPKDNDWQKEFEGEFPFDLTRDQEKSIVEIKIDMESSRPMDRLLCGDVGYGKTEVALRAAFKAVNGNKQVVFLVPTTILAEQHYLLFANRVKNFPVRVEVLSRFKTKAEQKKIVKDMNAGLVDVVIGTHRLFSSDIKFKNLGLVIVDEEQRFGVRHKEKLKQLRTLVDVLTLTATPIPRTLYLSLMGARDMSVINTPPKSRLPVHTEVLDLKEEKLVQIFERELERKGQIFFVHNRVQSIEKISKKLTKLFPKVRFAVAHGQLPPKTLEHVLMQFMQNEVDCLICSNIIESGVDIPNANTIIVNRADLFGLADLYQLRGRVGRYAKKRKAYAYFFVPKSWRMTEEAEKRLSAIERFTDLGSGFKIAMEDLEIRGAGNLIGSEQSGFIHQVGFDMYCRLLQQMIDEERKRLK